MTTHRSVRELAASLATKGVAAPPEEGAKKKSSSLPRNTAPAAAGGKCVERSALIGSWAAGGRGWGGLCKGKKIGMV